MSPLDLVNHLRQCDLGEFREKLEKLQQKDQLGYDTVSRFILSCKPKENKNVSSTKRP